MLRERLLFVVGAVGCLFVLLILVTVSGVIAQEDVPITVFVDEDTLIVFVPGNQLVSLEDLGFEVAIGDNRKTLYLDQYISFQTIHFDAVHAPICFRLARDGTHRALPLDCDPNRTLTHYLADADVFWFDSVANQTRTLLIVSGASPLDFCAAGQAQCSIVYVPPSSTPASTSIPEPTSVPDYTLTPTEVITSDFTGSFPPISSLNADQLEPGYALTDFVDFSPDGIYIAVSGDGVYNAHTGQRLFKIGGLYGKRFSPDGLFLAVSGDGVYEVSSGIRVFGFSDALDSPPSFSPDSRYVAASEDGVYSVSTGQRLFPLVGYNPVFSPDGTMVVAAEDGVYNVASGERLFTISGGFGNSFSPDSKLLAVSKDGLFEISTRNRLFSISDLFPIFSPDGRYLAVRRDGVYEVTSGQKLFSIGFNPVFSPDGTLIAASGDGVYDVPTGQRLFSISDNATFNPAGNLLAVDRDGIYDVTTGIRLVSIPGYSSQFSPDGSLLAMAIPFNYIDGVTAYSVLYGLADNPWPYRSGLVELPKGVPISTGNQTGEGVFPVLARSADNQWYRIGTNQWVGSAEADVLFMPANIPIEEK